MEVVIVLTETFGNEIVFELLNVREFEASVQDSECSDVVFKSDFFLSWRRFCGLGSVFSLEFDGDHFCPVAEQRLRVDSAKFSTALRTSMSFRMMKMYHLNACLTMPFLLYKKIL